RSNPRVTPPAGEAGGPSNRRRGVPGRVGPRECESPKTRSPRQVFPARGVAIFAPLEDIARTSAATDSGASEGKMREGCRYRILSQRRGQAEERRSTMAEPLLSAERLSSSQSLSQPSSP